MSCDCSKDCHQNSSFIFGIVIGLIIAAVVAIVIYKNNRQDVLVKLKKQIEKFFSTIGRPTSGKKNPPIKKVKKLKKKVVSTPMKKTPVKKEVVIPEKLIIATIPKPVSKKASKMFKK
ncbi:hypothetical protein KBB48_02405 [Candidatus Shapirobacteria bacterium]|nr:hypothetical protein [Candidatus Shapirobacteria bacterium]